MSMFFYGRNFEFSTTTGRTSGFARRRFPRRVRRRDERYSSRRINFGGRALDHRERRPSRRINCRGSTLGYTDVKSVLEEYQYFNRQHVSRKLHGPLPPVSTHWHLRTHAAERRPPEPAAGMEQLRHRLQSRESRRSD